MPSSVFAPDFKSVLDAAKAASGQSGGPFPSPMDWRDLPIYFLMVDRFNNPSAPPRHQPFDDPILPTTRVGNSPAFARSFPTSSSWCRRDLAEPGAQEPAIRPFLPRLWYS